jgi:hypothetical protein
MLLQKPKQDQTKYKRWNSASRRIVGLGQDRLTLEVKHAQAYEWHENDMCVSIALDRQSEQQAQGAPKRN